MFEESWPSKVHPKCLWYFFVATVFFVSKAPNLIRDIQGHVHFFVGFLVRYWFNEKAKNSEQCFRSYGILLGQAGGPWDPLGTCLG